MNNYVIITDSCCDLPQRLASEMALSVINLSVLVGDKSYVNHLDWRDISGGAFYDLLRDKNASSTSAPSIGDFVQVMEPLLKEGKDILSITLSSALSGTHQVCTRIAEVSLNQPRG